MAFKVSDDPDYYVEPTDLFDEQKNGLPDWYGKKDKGSTEQAFFNCNICECELKSVVNEYSTVLSFAPTYSCFL